MDCASFFAALGKGQVRLRVIGGGRARKLDWSPGVEQPAGTDVYFVVNDGGDREADITACRAFFVEWDDRPIEWQLTAWRELGLPEPSFQVLTGGKSVHNYWVLDEPCRVDQWRNIQQRLIHRCGSDPALKDPCRVMRVPGFKHSKTGGVAEVVHSSDARVSLRELDALLPLIPKREIVRKVAGYDQGTMSEVVEALGCIPARTGAGTGTYTMYRNILWGLIKACEEAGGSRDDALGLVAGWEGIDTQQVGSYDATQVHASTFWWWAYQYGYQRPLRLPESMGKPDGQGWLQRLGWVAPDDKLVTPTPLALCTVLESVGDTIRWNRLNNRIEIDRQEVDDVDAQHLYIDLEGCGVKAKKDTMTDALIRTARRNQFHPVREYLETCDVPLPEHMWENITGELLGSGADVFDNAMLRKWLIFAVARIYDPGCAFGTVHILSGEGMSGKSRFFQELAGGSRHFLEGFEPSSNEKDDAMKLHSRWICEWGELDGGISLRANTRLKNMLSTREDSFRAPYGKSVGNYPRQFVICGTTNKSTGFFTDETGNRRYVVFHVQEPIDHSKVIALRDGLWASARRDYLNGVAWWPSQDEMGESELKNRELFTEDPWKSIVQAGAEVQHRIAGYVLSDELMSKSLDIPTERQGQREQMRVNRILKSLGYFQTRKKLSSGYRSIWRIAGT